MSKKISGFTELATQPATTDLFLLELASSGAYRKIKWSNLVADGSVTAAKLASNAVTTVKIANDAVTATKIDWASTGVDAGIWWEELGRTTLGVAGDTISCASLPAGNFIQFRFRLIASGSITGGIRFNNDSGSNYTFRYNADGSLSSTVSTTSINALNSGGTVDVDGVGEVFNASASQVKRGKVTAISVGTAAGTAPSYADFWFSWVNTSAVISRIDMVNLGAGDFAIGSELVILGHN